MITKDAIEGTLRENIAKYPLNEITGLVITVRTHKGVSLLNKSQMSENFSVDLKDLAERIYQRQLNFALTNEEVQLGCTLVRLSQDWVNKSLIPIRKVVGEKPAQNLARRAINTLLDVVCFDEREIRSVLNFQECSELSSRLKKLGLKLGDMRSPLTRVSPPRKEKGIDICCNFLVTA